MNLKKTALDKDLKRIGQIEAAARASGRRLGPLGLSAGFLLIILAVAMITVGDTPQAGYVVVAAVIGAYMALNIGANDVANNVGPAVGSKALTMVGALIIATLAEAAGAILAGGDVVSTIKKGIIDPAPIGDPEIFIQAMMAALLSAALWINLATYFNAPVSTTHSVVGGVMGAGIMAAGFGSVSWGTMAKIAASWVISPVLGGVIAAAFLLFIKVFIFGQHDKVAAAKRWVPMLVGVMAAAFTIYLMIKGFKKIWRPSGWVVLASGAIAFALVWAGVRPLVARAAIGLENRRKAVSSLFTIPLIFSATLLSFAHGANDVANAVGPLAAVVDAATSGEIARKVAVPLWVLVIGGFGISLGLFLFGPKLIRTVGEKITKLDRARAFCVALSAAITVIAASWLGLPVSSTHIAVGGIFGVGFLREFLVNRKKKRARHDPLVGDMAGVLTLERKVAKSEKRRLVRRQRMMTIVAAWVITVPLAAVLAALLFTVINTALG